MCFTQGLFLASELNCTAQKSVFSGKKCIGYSLRNSPLITTLFFHPFHFADNEGSWQGSFFFIQSADPQYGMIASFKNEDAPATWEEEIELTKQAVAAANKMKPKPKFFIVCGDLVHDFPGTCIL